MALWSPTERQIRYAVAIAVALGDETDLSKMTKWEMRDYISKALESDENRRKIREYTARKMKHRFETENRERNKFRRPYLTDESLGGEWGLDASDFGTWGDN